MAVQSANARPKLRGMTLGKVGGFDEDKDLVMVDIGSGEGVLRGMTFAVVDERGGQVALIEAGEVFDDLFWSAPLKTSDFRRVQYGMQVRWVFTPEMSALIAARNKGTPEAYRRYLETYPDGKLVTELVRNMDPDMMQALDPAFRAAWDEYTPKALDAYAEAHPRTALGKAALDESESIKKYEAEQEKLRKDTEKATRRPAEGGPGQAAPPVTGGEEDPFNVRYKGALVNNSSQSVTFEIAPPGVLPKTTVGPFERVEVTHPQGTYTYNVYPVEDDFGGMGGFGDFGGIPPDSGFGEPAAPDMGGFAQPPSGPVPLKVGEVDIQFDDWEITYP